MILLYGRLDDPPLLSTLQALQETGAEYLLLDQTTLDREDLSLVIGSDAIGGALTAAGQVIPLESLHSIYARPLELGARLQRGRAAIIHEQLVDWLDVAPALVVNRPFWMQTNASKPLQIQLIGAAGFEVPETLVTSDADEALAFWHEHGRVVYKSTSGIRSIVQELDERAAARLEQLSLLPVQFQAFVPGVDVRVHVVGDQAFAAEIVGAGVDYRYATRNGSSTTMTAITLAPEVEHKCVALSRSLGLPLSGIDLRRRPNGQYVCFEVNPMPAYTYFEAHAGLPIARALADLLVEGPLESNEVMHGARHREPHATRRHNRFVQAPSDAA